MPSIVITTPNKPPGRAAARSEAVLGALRPLLVAAVEDGHDAVRAELDLAVDAVAAEVEQLAASLEHQSCTWSNISRVQYSG